MTTWRALRPSGPLPRLIVPVLVLSALLLLLPGGTTSAYALEFDKDGHPLEGGPLIESRMEPVHATDEEWEKFLGENLYPDIFHWRMKGPLRTNDTLVLYDKLMMHQYLPAVFKLVLVYNNRIYWPTRTDVNGTDPPHPASPYKTAFMRTVERLLVTGRLKLPNSLFVFSSEDNRPRWCSPHMKCPVPLISLAKTILPTAGGPDTDILIPQFLWNPVHLYHYPWALKKDVAYFRGVPFCSTHWFGSFGCSNACPRTYLAWKSWDDANKGVRPPTLDVALVEPFIHPHGINTSRECAPVPPPIVARTPVAHHTYYRYLLHLEGIAASYRLSQLFHTNSLVLFQQQPFIEYFYRSLKPWVHYVPFWNTTHSGMNDIYEVLQQLRAKDRENPAALQRVIHEAQNFALKYTSLEARARYLASALGEYGRLFADHEEFIHEYVQTLRARGFPIP